MIQHNAVSAQPSTARPCGQRITATTEAPDEGWTSRAALTTTPIKAPDLQLARGRGRKVCSNRQSQMDPGIRGWVLVSDLPTVTKSRST
jgi:hypothetical protein